MKRFTPLQRVAALTLAIALAPVAASAQEDGTVTISGLFSMDYLYGDNELYYVAPELLGVFANGQQHTWTLTLHGSTQMHYSNGSYFGTGINATSFDLEFFGPDAATLNGFVRDHLAGGHVSVYLQNYYDTLGGSFATMYVRVDGNSGTYFYSGQDTGALTLFPGDADGYPVLGPAPFSIESEYTELGYFDIFSDLGGAIGSVAGLVTFEGSVPPPLPTLSIQDGSVLEGNKGTTYLNLTVTLSPGSTSTVTVNYATANGTAIAGSDYNSAIGTLTFQPGQTSKKISISVKGDRKREPNETVLVDLFEPDGATLADGVATGTILNDD